MSGPGPGPVLRLVAITARKWLAVANVAGSKVGMIFNTMWSPRRGMELLVADDVSRHVMTSGAELLTAVGSTDGRSGP